jgi:hypothetical protein
MGVSWLAVDPSGSTLGMPRSTGEKYYYYDTFVAS